MHVSCDIRFWLQFDIFGAMHRANDGSIDHSVGHAYLPFNLCLFAQNQRAGLIICGGNVAAHASIHPKAAGEGYVALDDGTGADQAVDPILRFGWFCSEH